MSIMSVVYVPEGITIATDSRLTVATKNGNITDRFILSDNAQKLFLLSNHKVGISSCGNAQIDGKTIADFVRLFEIEILEKDSKDVDIHIIVQKFKDYLPSSANSQFYICGYVDDVAFIYFVTKDEIVLNNTGVDYGASWSGQTEAANKLMMGEKQTNIVYPLTPLKDGIDLAEFIIDVTIKYQRFETKMATCGGPIDVLVITKDYAKFIKHKLLT